MRWQIWWQPLVRLDTGALLGYECLARGGSGLVQEWLRHGGWRADLMLVQQSLRTLRYLDRGQQLFINLGSELVEAVLRGWVLLPVAPHVVWEIAEGAWLGTTPAVTARRVLGEFALDDCGAGSGDLQRLLEYRPPWVKLDRALAAGLARDRTRQELVRGLVAAVTAYGGSVVLEGLEAPDDTRAAAELQVAVGQGYCVGVPQPPERWARARVPAWGEAGPSGPITES